MSFSRTAYAKGFNKETTTLDELLDHYNEANPDVVSIQMRNYCEKKGKEKVFHIFSHQVFECCPGVEVQRVNLLDFQN